MVARSWSVLVCLFDPRSIPPLYVHLGMWPVTMLAIKRLAGVASEVNLRHCTVHSPQQKGIRQIPPAKGNKAESTLALKPRGDVTRNPKWSTSRRQNNTQLSVCQKHLKNKVLILRPGRWHNGSAFVFCLSDWRFESKPSPSSADACEEVTSCAVSH